MGIKEGSSLRHDYGRPRASDVIDVLPGRSASSIAAWLAERPSIELIARDRDGLYADAARQGAPQAKQTANRFHLVQNLRAAIERQLSGLKRPSTAAAPILVASLTAVARRQLAKPAYKASRES